MVMRTLTDAQRAALGQLSGYGSAASQASPVTKARIPATTLGARTLTPTIRAAVSQGSAPVAQQAAAQSPVRTASIPIQPTMRSPYRPGVTPAGAGMYGGSAGAQAQIQRTRIPGAPLQQAAAQTALRNLATRREFGLQPVSTVSLGNMPVARYAQAPQATALTNIETRLPPMPVNRYGNSGDPMPGGGAAAGGDGEWWNAETQGIPTADLMPTSSNLADRPFTPLEASSQSPRMQGTAEQFRDRALESSPAYDEIQRQQQQGLRDRNLVIPFAPTRMESMVPQGRQAVAMPANNYAASQNPVRQASIPFAPTAPPTRMQQAQPAAEQAVASPQSEYIDQSGDVQDELRRRFGGLGG